MEGVPKFMDKTFNLIGNLTKILGWIFMLIVLISWFGLILGILLSFICYLIWNISLTLMHEYSNDGLKETEDVFKIIFSTDILLPFTAYGCYCSPKYGVDGRTNGLKPIDDLDEACRIHDNVMLAINYQFMSGSITKSEYIKNKNQGDWVFVKSVFTSENSASGLYILGLFIGFLFRIIGRTITKA